jgi:molybdopterin-guanine dinucleotide biosynthesis protein A
MGMSKAWLPWHDRWAVVEIGLVLAERCEPVLLSKAPGQSLPPTPPSWRIVDDDEPEGGPLAALATACRALDDAAFAGALVATCDQAPEALYAAANLLLDGVAQECKSRIFFDEVRWQPFPGYYSAAALRSIAETRGQGITSMHAFLDSLGDRIEIVPSSQTPIDWDDPQTYLAAASAAGFEPPAWCREALGRGSGDA